ncbi:histone-like nucleoid-structuring protein Lsr2 [Saccharopolyspora sp. ASAGF58]|uniref:Lsr2 dimerization domain-containing protein n=1 Tax=Saccharopolyspora sp. ASAGF58 TaxID=2719023 RepID=UPI00144022EA|nr:histone-like nucleoid-structuring protein Lsr2 [Saccharopolyspora sp. ASAGF58]QIZ37921.1 Lsr2 family protein [Saccharopolyspora sp. ASAGF58]
MHGEKGDRLGSASRNSAPSATSTAQRFESIVEFSSDGANYAIGLSSENAAKLRDSLASSWSNARKAGGRKRAVAKTGKSAATATTAGRERSQAIRDRDRKQGMRVLARARIPVEVVESYENQH